MSNDADKSTSLIDDEDKQKAQMVAIEMDKQEKGGDATDATDTTKNENDDHSEQNVLNGDSNKTKMDAECREPGEFGPCCYKSLPGPFKYETHLKYWTVSADATKFWNEYGKQIANKNLFISIGNLLLAFAVWLIWSIINVLLLDSWESTCGDDTNEECYYHFSSWKKDMTPEEYKAALWILPATAGLS
eukprot:492682_1